MKKLFFCGLLFFIVQLHAQKAFNVGSKKFTLPGESLYGCFAVEFGDGRPIAYELNFYLDIQGDKLNMYESWEDVKGSAKLTVYTCKISKMNLNNQVVTIDPSDKKDSTKGSWDLFIPCSNKETAVSYKQYFRSGESKSGKLDNLKISFANRQKAVNIYEQLISIQKNKGE